MTDTPPNDDALDLLDVDASQDLVAIRGYAKRLEKRLAEAKKVNDGHELKLAKFETDARETLIQSEAAKAGLSKEQLESLLKIRPDADVEAVVTFAKTLGVEPKVEGAPDEGAPPADGAPPVVDNGKPVPPVSGSSVPTKAFTSEDIAAALKRGDTASIEKAVNDAVAHPERLQLKHGDLIPD